MSSQVATMYLLTNTEIRLHVSRSLLGLDCSVGSQAAFHIGHTFSFLHLNLQPCGR